MQYTGIQFTETMRGFFSTISSGVKLNKQLRDECKFTVTIHSNNLEEFLSDPKHKAMIQGTVHAPLLSDKPLTVKGGMFNLFVEDDDRVETSKMVYRLPLKSAEGNKYYIEGYKLIHNDSGFDLWPDTTTLFISVYEGPDDKGPLIGKGTLRISAADFLKLLSTIRILNQPSMTKQLKALARFGKFFTGKLFNTYAAIFSKQHLYNPNTPPRQRRPLRTAAPETYYFTTSENLQLRLLRYNGGYKGPVMLSHGFATSSVTYNLDTIDTNLTEYLYEQGYDVWLLDYRLSIETPYTSGQWTMDDIAEEDYPAAVEKIRQITGADKIDILAHCVGAITAVMAVLKGMEGVRSMMLFQVATHIQPPFLNNLKTKLYIPTFLKKIGIQTMTSYTDVKANWKNRFFNKALRLLYPKGANEHCKNPTCHRLTFMYGRIVQHNQLNQLTHDTLSEQLGEANLTTFEHLALIFRERKLLRADGADVYLPHLNRMAMPITLFSGEDSNVFLPEGMEKSYLALCAENGSHLCKRHVLKGYGHNDCLIGKNVVRDVFPHILEHLDKVEELESYRTEGYLKSSTS
ncbi:hypothetical protein A8F94_14415 [Bacillus sp. FJAT-27225]|uniref:alpha/beta hydrolase n=1 Tax=Bacillus sp. FJAT-27225 TaxID=1743144 RepID=UPI00080C243E|nr:alpha/beta fold hydrolase [Bacillus sp. FJAT-27225]OCA86033.1 hypothetical protein A8F94_14415 [Bacillus sp. FJAT-27225]